MDPRRAARETLHYLGRNGIDGDPLLSEAELSRSRLSEDPAGISFTAQTRFLELAAIEANDSLLGLHVAAEMDLRDAGILFYLAASSATVKDALEYVVRYAGAAGEAIHLDISQENGETVPECALCSYLTSPTDSSQSVLPNGKVQTAAVAPQLGMSVRSLTRHLAEEGTRFSEILDRLRHRLALRYLEDRRISIQQIAWLLGYSEIGAFNHAFKRWT